MRSCRWLFVLAIAGFGALQGCAETPTIPKTVEVSGPVPSWGDFAVQHNTSYRMLKLYNPWLVDSKLTNKAGKKYLIRLPAK